MSSSSGSSVFIGSTGSCDSGASLGDFPGRNSDRFHLLLFSGSALTSTMGTCGSGASSSPSDDEASDDEAPSDELSLDPSLVGDVLKIANRV